MFHGAKNSQQMPSVPELAYPGMDAWSGVSGSQAKEKTQKNISVPA